MIVCLTVPGRPYLARTLASIDGRNQRRVLVVDGDRFDDPPSGWEVVFAPRPCALPNNKWATWRAFELAAEADEDLIFTEDDVEWCRNGVEFAAGFPVPPEAAWISFFAAGGDMTFPPGLWLGHGSTFNFCQALKIPLRTLRIFTGASGQHVMRTSRMGGSDEIMREIADRADLRYGLIYPGIAQHLGVVSVVDPSRDIRAGRWSRACHDRDFNALSLRYISFR